MTDSFCCVCSLQRMNLESTKCFTRFFQMSLLRSHSAQLCSSGSSTGVTPLALHHMALLEPFFLALYGLPLLTLSCLKDLTYLPELEQLTMNQVIPVKKPSRLST